MGDHELHPATEADSERGRALVQAAVMQTHAPLALRERIEADRARAAKPARRRWTLGGSFAAGMAAIIAAIVVATGGGGTAGLSVAQAAVLAQRAPTGPAPAVDPRHPGLLKRSVGGVTYPSWQDQFPWKATGVRQDTINGRKATTVFYKDPAGHRIGYTIIDGAAIPEPSGPGLTQGTEHYVVLHNGARTIVTWRRGGHTCILSGSSGVAKDRLLALASWSGTGVA